MRKIKHSVFLEVFSADRISPTSSVSYAEKCFLRSTECEKASLVSQQSHYWRNHTWKDGQTEDREEREQNGTSCDLSFAFLLPKSLKVTQVQIYRIHTYGWLRLFAIISNINLIVENSFIIISNVLGKFNNLKITPFVSFYGRNVLCRSELLETHSVSF